MNSIYRKLAIILTILSAAFYAGYFVSSPNFVVAQPPPEPTPPDPACIGRAVGLYAETVLSTVGRVQANADPAIRFLTPAWNMTNAFHADIVGAFLSIVGDMDSNFYAVAGNAYNLYPNTFTGIVDGHPTYSVDTTDPNDYIPVTQFLADSRAITGSNRYMITEWGWFPPNAKQELGTQVVVNVANEGTALKVDGGVFGAG